MLTSGAGSLRFGVTTVSRAATFRLKEDERRMKIDIFDVTFVTLAFEQRSG